VRGENWSTRGKSLGAEETTNKLFPHNYTEGSGNWTQAILVEGECSLHCANPAHWVSEWQRDCWNDSQAYLLCNLFDCLSVGLSHNSKWCTLIPCFLQYFSRWEEVTLSLLVLGELTLSRWVIFHYNYSSLQLLGYHSGKITCFPPNGGVLCWLCSRLSDVFHQFSTLLWQVVSMVFEPPTVLHCYTLILCLINLFLFLLL